MFRKNVYNDDKDLKLVSYFLTNPSLDDPNLIYDKQTFEIEGKSWYIDAQPISILICWGNHHTGDG